MGLTFDTATSLFECVDVGVNTTFTVQLVPSQVPRQEALLEEEKNCSRTVLGIPDKSMELTCCAMMRSSSEPTDASCQLQPPCSLPQGWQGPAIFGFLWKFVNFCFLTCMSLKVRKCINPSELKHDLSSEGSKFLSIRNCDDVREGR